MKKFYVLFLALCAAGFVFAQTAVTGVTVFNWDGSPLEEGEHLIIKSGETKDLILGIEPADADINTLKLGVTMTDEDQLDNILPVGFYPNDAGDGFIIRGSTAKTGTRTLIIHDADYTQTLASVKITCTSSDFVLYGAPCGDGLVCSLTEDGKLQFWCGEVGSSCNSTPDAVPGVMDNFYYDGADEYPSPWNDYAGIITSIDLSNVSQIGDNAFRNCTRLTSLKLNENNALGDFVLLGCTGFLYLEVPGTKTPPTLSNFSLLIDAQTGKEVDLVFVESKGYIKYYQTDDKWGSYADRVFMVKGGEWNDVEWEVEPEADGTYSLSLDFTPTDPYDPEDVLILADVDTTETKPAWHNLRGQVRELVIGDRVSYIGRGVFASLDNVENIRLRQSEHPLDSIHIEAFSRNVTPKRFYLGEYDDGPTFPPEIKGWDGTEESLPDNFLEKTVLFVPDYTYNFSDGPHRSVEFYRSNPFWGRFNRVDDRTVAIDEVTKASAQMKWLPLEKAFGYRLTIHKEGCDECDTTIIIPADGVEGFIDWDNVTIDTYNAPRRKPQGDDGQGGMTILIEVKKGSGGASNQDVEINASGLAAGAQYSYTREVLNEGLTDIDPNLTKKNAFQTEPLPDYAVDFRDKDGNTFDLQSIEEGSTATTPDAPEVEGHHFVGWDDGSGFLLTKEQIDALAVTAPVSYTAVYELNIYTVTFVDWNGKVLFTQSVYWGTASDKPINPYREGYTFTGWDKDYSAVKEDMTITAQYKINTYTVTFLDWDYETVLKEQTVDWDTDATAPEDPEREGYHFTGWDPADFTHVKADLVVTAQYKINTYTVTFLDWDGKVLNEQTVDWDGAAIYPSDPSREGYHFTGWDQAIDHVKADRTVTAQYKINTYTVTFVDYDGTVLKEETVDWDTDATAPEEPSSIEGYHFFQWDKDFTHVKSDLTVTAQYTINTYTVTFVDWDGTVLKEQTVNWGSSATAPEDPEREGYVFTGWDTSFTVVTSDLTVKAQYTEKAPTGIDEGPMTNDQLPMTNKIIIDNQLYILVGEKMYDANGRLVK